MKFFTSLYTPFPRPKCTRKNIILVTVVGISAGIFIILFEPFGIENTTGQWYVDLVFFSLGILFILSILFIEFFIPKLIPKPFLKWNVGKALLWYTFVIVFVAIVQFIYKSWWGGWHDFTFLDFIMVLGRILAISFIIVFFVLGIWQYMDGRKLANITSKEHYSITSMDGKSIKLKIKEILYVASDDNYVDIHLEENNTRKKIILRSSLKNIEKQLVNPLSPIYRCHRKYLINAEHFKMIKDSSRKMIIGLKKYEDEVTVSANYMNNIRQRLQNRP